VSLGSTLERQRTIAVATCCLKIRNPVLVLRGARWGDQSLRGSVHHELLLSPPEFNPQVILFFIVFFCHLVTNPSTHHYLLCFFYPLRDFRFCILPADWLLAGCWIGLWKTDFGGRTYYRPVAATYNDKNVVNKQTLVSSLCPWWANDGLRHRLEIIGPIFSNRADGTMRIALALLLAVSGDAINFVAGLAEPKTRFYSQRLFKAPPKTSRVYKTTRQSQQP
jgi:hypothetical protein